MAEAPANQGESNVSLEDVCLRFTAEEWGLLDDAQKLLYHNVMLENFSLVLSLGLPISKSFPGTPVTDANKDYWFTKAVVKGMMTEGLSWLPWLVWRMKDVSQASSTDPHTPELTVITLLDIE